MTYEEYCTPVHLRDGMRTGQDSFATLRIPSCHLERVSYMQPVDGTVARTGADMLSLT